MRLEGENQTVTIFIWLGAMATPPTPTATAAATATARATTTATATPASSGTRVVATYIWIDAEGGLRSKATVLLFVGDSQRTMCHYLSLANPAGSASLLREDRKFGGCAVRGIFPHFPEWNFDGSSTGQATTENSEIVLRPVRACLSPFLTGVGDSGIPAFLVLCTALHMDGTPALGNQRMFCVAAHAAHGKADPWYGYEQEFFLTTADGKPLTTVEQAKSENGRSYCGVGAAVVRRDVMDAIVTALMTAGLDLGGWNAEVAPGQWEYQIGPSQGVDAGDQLWLSRYIASRVAESFGLQVSLAVKPFADWNGSGCHTNVSTKATREGENGQSGMEVMVEYLERLGRHHKSDMEHYGTGNAERLTGTHETASYSEFSWSIGGRHSSVRVGHQVRNAGKGYFEDRRPGGNMDPYNVSGLILNGMYEK